MSLLSFSAQASNPGEIVIRVTNPSELAAVQPLLMPSTQAEGHLVISVAPGHYELHDSIRIQRSGVSLRGDDGVTLFLANGVNEPVIAIGTQAEVAGVQDMISQIAISGLTIDGNKENQSSETSLVRPWIRNNGIDVRAVSDLTIERVSVNNNRSGGLVISWGCSRVRVSESGFARNFFDGVAFYASADVVVANCSMTDNLAAGVSLDNEFIDSAFIRCLIEGNGDVGVFARSSERLQFNDCVVRGSGNWAYFLAHDDSSRGVFDIAITGGQVVGNRGGVCVASIDEQQSRGTRITGAAFADNLRDGRSNVWTAGSAIQTAELVELSAPEELPNLGLAVIR